MISMREYANTLLASMAAAQVDPRGYRIENGKIVTLTDVPLPPESPDDPRTNDLDEGEDDED